jgi:biotin carboxyl carrier protein
MRYFVEVAGRERVVQLEHAPDGGLRVLVDGREVAVDAVSLASRELSVRVDGRVLDLSVEGAAPQMGVVASGHRAYVKVESERMRLAHGVGQSAGGAHEREVRSPMPGRVVKVLVNAGDEVRAGQALVIVEAMKMENEVRARLGGTVARVHVVQGATVESNAVLVSFAAPSV